MKAVLDANILFPTILREILIDLVAQLEQAFAAGNRTDARAVQNWWQQIDQWRQKKCLEYKNSSEIIKPQFVVQKLWEVTGGDAFVTSDLRHHPVDEALREGGPCIVDTAHWASEFPWSPAGNRGSSRPPGQRRAPS